MNDNDIVTLYHERNETAITLTAEKYGSYCRRIAASVLSDRSDAEECVNDTWLDAWNSMPPHKPQRLATFLGKLTRRIAIDRYRENTAVKRGGTETPLVLDELADCLPAATDTDEQLDRRLLQESIRAFLQTLKPIEQRVFLCRYWYMDSIEAIASRFGFSQSKVKSMLARTRRKLRTYLDEKEARL